METREEWESALGMVDFLFHVAQGGVHSLHEKKDITSKQILLMFGKPPIAWKSLKRRKMDKLSYCQEKQKNL